MQGELTGLDALFLAALFDQPLGQLGAFAISDHPTGVSESASVDIRTSERVCDRVSGGSSRPQSHESRSRREKNENELE